MDALEKLAEKNRTHRNHIKAERIMTLLMIVGLLPFYIDLVYAFIFADKTFPEELVFAAISGLGVFCFSFPLLAMGELIQLPLWVKVISLLLLETWFTFFWVFNNSSWLAFVVLIPVYVVFKIQIPAIKSKAESNGL